MLGELAVLYKSTLAPEADCTAFNLSEVFFFFQFSLLSKGDSATVRQPGGSTAAGNICFYREIEDLLCECHVHKHATGHLESACNYAEGFGKNKR